MSFSCVIFGPGDNVPWCGLGQSPGNWHSLLRLLSRRLLETLPVIIGVTLVAALLVHLIPGDPVTAMAGESSDPLVLERIREHYGLDRPFHQQYIDYVNRLAHLDFGRSFITGERIGPQLAERLPWTLALAGAAMLFATISGISLGLISAHFRNQWLDRLCQGAALAGISTPVFFLGLILLYIFSVRWQILPGAGSTTALAIILPAITLGAQSAALIARITRSTVLEILPMDHVTFARARGVSRFGILVRHVSANAAPPIFTVALLDLGSYLNGSVITETVFGWPGIGSYVFYEGILKRDFPVIQAVVCLGALAFILANLSSDLIHSWLDPRVREQNES